MIPLNLAADACVCAFVYDISGQMVRELYNASLAGRIALHLTIVRRGSANGALDFVAEVNVNNVVNARKIALMK
ncbi:MAG: hypothetical protein U5N56_03675 [Candidatus Marinimicrobia bacterium]|nr:hypothetical protein [Candidatus Neomarinimicrobiota bacterium]